MALERGSVLLVAPPGGGKTLALEEALAAGAGSGAWLRCGEADRDPGRLLAHLVDAVRSAAPGAVDVLADRLAVAPERVDVGLGVRALLGRARAPAGRPADDRLRRRRAAAPSREAVRLVGDLLAAAAPPVHVAIASRHELRLRAAKLRATGRLAEARRGGPRVQPGGVRRAAALRGAVATPPPTRSRRCGPPPRAGRWASRSRRAPAGAGEPGASAGALEAYLIEELLDPLDAALARRADRFERRSRSSTPPWPPRSGLPDGFVERGAARCGDSRSRRSTRAAERVAYHPLMREFLLARLDASARSRAAPAAAQRAAAEALEAAGRGPDAVEHWLAGGAPDSAASAVARHARPARANTAPATVAGGSSGCRRRRGPRPTCACSRVGSRPGRAACRTADRAAARGPARVRGPRRRRLDVAGARRARRHLRDPRGLRAGDPPGGRARGLAGARGADGRPLAASPRWPAPAAIGRPPGSARRARRRGRRRARSRRSSRGFRGFWVDLLCGRLDAALAGRAPRPSALERADPFNRLPYVLGFVAVIQDERGEDRGGAGAHRASGAGGAAQNGLGGYIGEVGSQVQRRRPCAGGATGRGRARARSAPAAAATAGFAGDGGDHARDDRRAARRARRGLRGRRSGARRRRARALAGALAHHGAAGPGAGRGGPAARGRASSSRTRSPPRPPLASCARLLALRGWLRSLDGDECRGARRPRARVGGGAAASPSTWCGASAPRLEPLLWAAVERGRSRPRRSSARSRRPSPGGAALLPFTRHPVPEVRRAADRSRVGRLRPSRGARAARASWSAIRTPEWPRAARACRARICAASRRRSSSRCSGGFGLRRGGVRGRRRGLGGAARRNGWCASCSCTASGRSRGRRCSGRSGRTCRPRPRRSLQVAVSSARAVLDPPRRRGQRAGGRRAHLPPGALDRDVVDADEFERAATRGARPPAVASGPRCWRPPRRAGAGEPLPEDRYEDWATAWRERLLDLYGRVLGALADARADGGRPAGRGRRRPPPGGARPARRGGPPPADGRLCALGTPRPRPAPVPRLPPRAGRGAGRRAGRGDGRAPAPHPRRRAGVSKP